MEQPRALPLDSLHKIRSEVLKMFDGDVQAAKEKIEFYATEECGLEVVRSWAEEMLRKDEEVVDCSFSWEDIPTHIRDSAKVAMAHAFLAWQYKQEFGPAPWDAPVGAVERSVTEEG